MPAVAKQPRQQDVPERWRPAPPDPEGLQRILVEVERPLIDAAVRARLLRLQQFYGEGHVRFLITTIVESEGNAEALVEPIVSAVSNIMKRRPDWPERGGQWLEAFDQILLLPLLQVFWDLNAFTDSELAHHYMIAVGRRVGQWFAEQDAPSVPPAVNRPSAARRAIEEGLELLKHKGPHANSLISEIAQEQFGMQPNECSKVMRAARIYGDRIWVVEKLSRGALFTLASPSLPASVREVVERRLRAGEVVRAPEIKRLRKGQ